MLVTEEQWVEFESDIIVAVNFATGSFKTSYDLSIASLNVFEGYFIISVIFAKAIYWAYPVGRIRWNVSRFPVSLHHIFLAVISRHFWAGIGRLAYSSWYNFTEHILLNCVYCCAWRSFLEKKKIILTCRIFLSIRCTVQVNEAVVSGWLFFRYLVIGGIVWLWILVCFSSFYLVRQKTNNENLKHTKEQKWLIWVGWSPTSPVSRGISLWNTRIQWAGFL